MMLQLTCYQRVQLSEGYEILATMTFALHQEFEALALPMLGAPDTAIALEVCEPHGEYTIVLVASTPVGHAVGFQVITQ